MITLKSERDIECMRDAGRIVGQTLDLIRDKAHPGITTKELDRLAEAFIRGKGATPSFKGYGGFPATLCTSVNEQVVHGIPGSYKLRDGDILSVDCGCVFKGWQGDAAVTIPIGNVSEDALRLIDVTRESFFEGVRQAVEGNRISDISHAVQVYAETRGYGVVRALCGHGIGREMHEDPEVPNYGSAGRGPRLRHGMTIAIEPMITAGTWQVNTLADGWTVVTKDGSFAAHYEHTVAITKDGPRILTLSED